MPIRGTSSNGVAAQNLVINTPAGVRAGDVMVMWLLSDYLGVKVITLPLGWRHVKPKESYVSVDTAWFTVGWRVAGPSEPASYTATISTDKLTGGIVALSGVTTEGIQAGHFAINTALGTPWQLAVPSFVTRGPCEVLAIANVDINVNANVAFTTKRPFSVAQEVFFGFDNVLVAHRVMRTRGHTGAVIGEGSYGTATAGLQLTTIVLPVRQPSQKVPLLPFRTLRPTLDLSNSGWVTP
jgi:hypothetical protein